MSKGISSELLRIENSRGFPPSCLLNTKGNRLMPDKRKPTFKVEPSSVLGNVKAFLPKLAVANKELERATPSEVDIENTDNCPGQVIEMNLALVQQADSDSSESDDSTSDTDSDSDSVILLSENGPFGEVNEGNMQLSRQRTKNKAKPEIIVLGETTVSSVVNGTQGPEENVP